MHGVRRILVAVAATALALSILVPSTAAAPSKASSTPRWLLHVQRYPGGISNGVRAMASPEVAAAQASSSGESRSAAPSASAPGNVQMNDDSFPPLPQNETSVAYSTDNPMRAVAAANDYVSGGVVVMTTGDGGRTWQSTRITPRFRTGDFCNGGDPSVAYSARDHVFLLSQLCFFRGSAPSEVQVFASADNGVTWTPGRQAAIAATNFDTTTGVVDESIFNDKEYIAVDNWPTSPHYGRLYVSYTKFHIAADGSSDYCPIQLSYTDIVPVFNPALTTFQHTAVVPDAPGARGLGPSSNQFSVPVIEKTGALDISYVTEECNTGLDHHHLMKKSSNGGASFGASVRIDKPGQFVDNPDLGDVLPDKKFRAPNTTNMAYSPTTGTLVYTYQNAIDQAASGTNISYQVSHDGGITWSGAGLLSTAGSPSTPAPNDQFFPWVAAAPDGTFVAIWFDCRRDPANHLIDTFEATSADDGVTWSNRRISTVSWDADLGFFTSGAFIGDYNGLAVSSKASYPVWTDGRASAIAQTGIGETDIFTDVEPR